MAGVYCITPEIRQNITAKISSHLEREVDEGQLKITIFSDNELESKALWGSVFDANVKYKYSSEFPLIPLPNHYTGHAEIYRKYDLQLFAYIIGLLNKQNIPCLVGVFNLGDIAHPKMNLVLVDRWLELNEFGIWVLDLFKQCDKCSITDSCQEELIIERRRRQPRSRDKLQATDEAPPGVTAVNPHASLFGEEGEVSRDRTRSDTLTSVEELPMDSEIVVSVNDDPATSETATSISTNLKDEIESCASGYVPDPSEECSASEKTATTSPVRVYPLLSRTRTSTLRRLVYLSLKKPGDLPPYSLETPNRGMSESSLTQTSLTSTSLTPTCETCGCLNTFLSKFKFS